MVFKRLIKLIITGFFSFLWIPFFVIGLVFILPISRFRNTLMREKGFLRLELRNTKVGLILNLGRSGRAFGCDSGLMSKMRSGD